MAEGGHQGVYHYDEYQLKQKFMVIVREDVACQKGIKFFVDKEVVDKCYNEIREARDETVIDEFLLKYCSSVLSLNESCKLTDAPRKKLTMYNLISMGGSCGHHLMYMAMRADDDKRHRCFSERKKAVKLLKDTAIEMGKQPSPEVLRVDNNSESSDESDDSDIVHPKPEQKSYDSQIINEEEINIVEFAKIPENQKIEIAGHLTNVFYNVIKHVEGDETVDISSTNKEDNDDDNDSDDSNHRSNTDRKVVKHRWTVPVVRPKPRGRGRGRGIGRGKIENRNTGPLTRFDRSQSFSMDPTTPGRIHPPPVFPPTIDYPNEYLSPISHTSSIHTSDQVPGDSVTSSRACSIYGTEGQQPEDRPDDNPPTHRIVLPGQMISSPSLHPTRSSDTTKDADKDDFIKFDD